MFANWTVPKRVLGGYAVGALILLVIMAFAYRTTSALIENQASVSHTYLVRQRLADLLADLINVETGARGFVITGSSSFLQPYQAARDRIKTEADDFQRLTVDNPHQQSRAAALRPEVKTQLDFNEQAIALRKNSGLDAATKLIDTGQGKAVMDRIRDIIGAANDEEGSLLQIRNRATEASAAWAIGIILGAGAVGVFMKLLIGWIITRSLASQVGTAVGHVQSSSSELQAVANQQASGAREQATAMSEITTTITELLATSRQIAESAQRIAQIAEQTAGGARTGQEAVDSAQEAIAGIRRQVDQIVGYMLELGKKSQQIGTVLDIVSELADQTNILAINATIEGVGAGENGRRFAVVAEEIRKLADRVAQSTKEIRSLIDDVRSAVNTTVMATETGSKAVDLGAEQFAQVALGFRQVASLVATTTDAAREIELSTKQQASAVEQVNLAMANVAQASRETEASAGQTLQTAAELAHLSTDLARIVRPQQASPLRLAPPRRAAA